MEQAEAEGRPPPPPPKVTCSLGPRLPAGSTHLCCCGAQIITPQTIGVAVGAQPPARLWPLHSLFGGQRAAILPPAGAIVALRPPKITREVAKSELARGQVTDTLVTRVTLPKPVQ